jgi:hypothetical protein
MKNKHRALEHFSMQLVFLPQIRSKVTPHDFQSSSKRPYKFKTWNMLNSRDASPSKPGCLPALVEACFIFVHLLLISNDAQKFLERYEKFGVQQISLLLVSVFRFYFHT